MKLWTGRFKKQLDNSVNDFNSSIKFDCRMAYEDIDGSIAHVTMLLKTGIISEPDYNEIITNLKNIKSELNDGSLLIDYTAEDIHTFIEQELTKRTPAGKRLHTGRSRNDQVALDIRLYLKGQIDYIKNNIASLIAVLCDIAEQHSDTVMPGYTHLQRAQPISFGHHILAYAEMLIRDYNRLSECYNRLNMSPLGAGALAGTTYPLDRHLTAELLKMDGVTHNSLDSVSDRDFTIELASDLSILMMHLSRFCDEIILWCSAEFKFIELDDAFSTGSSIMPQKKNPDIAELIRGKTGRVYGSLIALLTMMKGIPLAYNKDMQEDKEAVFNCIDTVNLCLESFTPMLKTMTVLKDNMRAAGAHGFINATDCADYLVKKGLAFRDAYKIVGELVAYCIEHNKTLEDLTVNEYKAFNEIFEEDIYEAISLDTCLSKREVYGGPAPKNVLAQVKRIRGFLSN